MAETNLSSSQENHSLADLLLALANESVALIGVEIKKGRLELRSLPYPVNEVSSYTYGNTPEEVKVQVKPVTKSYPGWSEASWQEFFEASIKTLHAFELARNALRTYEPTLLEEHDTEVDTALMELVSAVARDALASSAAVGIISDYVVDFIAELNNAPVDWDCTVWLQGIALPDAEYKLVTGGEYRLPTDITLRRPTEEDFEGACYPGTLYFQHLPLDSSLHPTAILSFTQKAQTKRQLEEQLDCFLVFLRMLDIGSVKYVRRFMQPQGKAVLRMAFLNSRPPDLGERHLQPAYHYIFDDSHCQAFSRLLPKIGVLFYGNRDDHIRVALNRYRQALFSEDSVRGRVATVISCLEALYTHELKKGGQYTIRHRMAALLGSTFVSPVESQSVRKRALNDLETAYDIRNAHFHGNPPWNELSRQDVKNLRSELKKLSERMERDSAKAKKEFQKLSEGISNDAADSKKKLVELSGRLEMDAANSKAVLNNLSELIEMDSSNRELELTLLCKRMLNYARVSLILFCQMPMDRTHDARVMKRVDEAILDFIGKAAMQDALKDLCVPVWNSNVG